MTISLCGNSYGCLSTLDDAIGEEFSYNGSIHSCGRCVSIAAAFVEFFVGEEIEFSHFLQRWMTTTQATEALMNSLLGRALQSTNLI